ASAGTNQAPLAKNEELLVRFQIQECRHDAAACNAQYRCAALNIATDCKCPCSNSDSAKLSLCPLISCISFLPKTKIRSISAGSAVFSTRSAFRCSRLCATPSKASLACVL